MKRLAVFYHARIEGGSAGIDPAYGRMMFQAQMDTFVASGLYEACNFSFIGLNGGGVDFVNENSPPGCCIVEHGAAAESLLPTYLYLEDWLTSHPDWYVCLWHTKGITHPKDPLNIVWRRCMEKCVIENWRQCIKDLDLGVDTAGAHWLTRDQYGPIVNTFFWGGAFFWAKAEFLLKLPRLIREVKTRDDWFSPEMWIGTGPRPSVRDYATHWPNLNDCGRMASQ